MSENPIRFLVGVARPGLRHRSERFLLSTIGSPRPKNPDVTSREQAAVEIGSSRKSCCSSPSSADAADANTARARY